MFPKCQICQMCNGNAAVNAPASPLDAAWAHVAALGLCATKTPGKAAAPSPGAQEKLRQGGKSPLLSRTEWIRAAGRAGGAHLERRRLQGHLRAAFSA